MLSTASIFSVLFQEFLKLRGISLPWLSETEFRSEVPGTPRPERNSKEGPGARAGARTCLPRAAGTAAAPSCAGTGSRPSSSGRPGCSGT